MMTENMQFFNRIPLHRGHFCKTCHFIKDNVTLIFIFWGEEDGERYKFCFISKYFIIKKANSSLAL